MASIIVIGNPGAGKSTILNGLAGEVLFESGISIGDGLTYQLDERENARGTFLILLDWQTTPIVKQQEKQYPLHSGKEEISRFCSL